MQRNPVVSPLGTVLKVPPLSAQSEGGTSTTTSTARPGGTLAPGWSLNVAVNDLLRPDAVN